MSILTKIFVFLQAVCSLVLAVLIVLLISKQERYRDMVTTLENSAIAQKAALGQSKATEGELREALNTKTTDTTQQLATLHGQIDKLTTDNQSLHQTGDQLTLDNQQQKLNVTTLSNVVDSEKSMLGAKDKELAAIRPENVRLTSQVGDLNRLLRTTQSERDLAVSTVRQLKEALAAEEEKGTPTQPAADTSNGGNAGTVANADVTGTTSVEVNGRVKEVKDVNGSKLVSLSLGSRDGVHTGTRFLVYRDSNYVGDVVIQQVTPDESVGKVTITAPGTTVQANDLVISGPNL